MAAAADEVTEADDQVTQLGPAAVALIRTTKIGAPLLEHALHLEDGRHDPVDVAPIERRTASRARGRIETGAVSGCCSSRSGKVVRSQRLSIPRRRIVTPPRPRTVTDCA